LMGNVLLIGLTNRRELLDPALIRPGRLEVQIRIGLPNPDGRREILKIHSSKLRKRGRISEPLSNAIDGPSHRNNSERRFRSFGRMRNWLTSRNSIEDLSEDKWTGGFSGADLAGLVRNAGSFALARARNEGDDAFQTMLITLNDVERALTEMNKR
jgi:vesicle-fusing ATPase